MIIPIVALVAMFFLYRLGCAMARGGAPFGLVKVLLYPAYTFFGNLFGVMPFIVCGWLLALFTGNRAMANYVVGNASELALLSSAFGDPITVPISHIIVYQFFIWLIFTRPIANMFTIAVYNSVGPNSAR